MPYDSDMRNDWLDRLSELQVNWLAGLLEGEGSFMAAPPSSPGRPRVAVSMTDEDIVARVAAMWQVEYRVAGDRRAKVNGWRVAYAARLTGRKAAELMVLIRPLMSVRRQGQIDTALASWAPAARKVTRGQGTEVIAAFKAGTAAVDLAEQYGVSKWTIYAIVEGKYFDRPGRPCEMVSESLPWPTLTRPA